MTNRYARLRTESNDLLWVGQDPLPFLNFYKQATYSASRVDGRAGTVSGRFLAATIERGIERAAAEGPKSTARFEVFPFSKSRIQRPPAREGRTGEDQGCVQAASYHDEPPLEVPLSHGHRAANVVEGGLENLSLLLLDSSSRWGAGRGATGRTLGGNSLVDRLIQCISSISP